MESKEDYSFIKLVHRNFYTSVQRIIQLFNHSRSASHLRRLEDIAEQTLINEEIKMQLRRDRRILRREVKMLLLGSNGSGKSTFIKQLKIIFGGGYTDTEKQSYINLVYQSVFQAMQSLICAMDILKIQYAKPSSVEKANLICSFNYETVASDCSFITTVRDLWNDNGVQECYSREGKHQLTDSAKYYLMEIDRIASPEYLPTEQDILHVYEPKTSITDYSFNFNEITIRLIDVSGQNSERRKWLNCFENIEAVIYFVALDEYDRMLADESGIKNCMEESKVLFKNILASTWFLQSNIIFLFNKEDLFKEKTMYFHLADYFPEYDGPRQNAFYAKKFIEAMFVDLCNPDNCRMNGSLFTYFTCATDTEKIKFVFASMYQAMNLQNFGIIACPLE